jgi:dihydrofolate reductase
MVFQTIPSRGWCPRAASRRSQPEERTSGLGGGVSVVRQYLQAKLVDEMHLVVSPILLGKGEHLFAGLDLPALGYRPREYVTTPNAMHVVFAREQEERH